MSKNRAIVYADRLYSCADGKTAHGLVRYSKKYTIACVVDSTLPKGDAATFLYLREPFFRIFYLPLRFLWGMSNRIAKPMVRAIAYIDAIFLNGDNGHILIYITRKTL